MHLTYKQSFYDYYKAYFRFLIEKCNQIKMGYILPLCAYYWEGSTFKMADLSDCKTKRNSESFLRHFFTAAICQSKCESQLSRKTDDKRNIFTLWPEFRSHCDSQFQMNTLIEDHKNTEFTNCTFQINAFVNPMMDSILPLVSSVWLWSWFLS